MNDYDKPQAHRNKPVDEAKTVSCAVCLGRFWRLMQDSTGRYLMCANHNMVTPRDNKARHDAQPPRYIEYTEEVRLA